MDQSNDLFAKAEAELASVDAQIATLQKRKTELANFVGLGRRLFSISGDSHAASVAGMRAHLQVMADPGNSAAAPAERQAKARDESMKAKVLNLARQCLTERPYAHTVQLVDYIENTGVAVTGKDKNITVSVILSRSPEFLSDRTRGWSLAEKNPQDVAASAGSSTA